MNIFEAKIVAIETHEHLSLVDFDVFGQTISMVSLGLDEEVRVGRTVMLSLNPTQLILAKEPTVMLSITNQLKATVLSCENGILLSSVKLLVGDVELESIITREAADRLALKEHDSITVLMQPSELSILKVLSC
jgi:molybdopterin-binding protein